MVLNQFAAAQTRILCCYFYFCYLRKINGLFKKEEEEDEKRGEEDGEKYNIKLLWRGSSSSSSSLPGGLERKIKLKHKIGERKKRKEKGEKK
jgi:hypothetical protein